MSSKSDSKAPKELTSGEIKIINTFRTVSSNIKKVYKSLIIRRPIIVASLVFLLGIGIPISYSLYIKKTGDELYRNAKYTESLEQYVKAKDWWVPEKIALRFHDRDLYHKIDKANVMIKSGEYYENGLQAFSEGKYQEAINYFSSMAERDPNIDDATSKIQECSSKIFELENQPDHPKESSLQQIPQQTTYPIITLGDISGLSDKDKIIITNAYNEFLDTPNLIYMNTNQQNELLKQIIEKHLLKYKSELLEEISATKEQLNNQKESDNSENDEINYPETPQIYVNTDIEKKLNELRDTLENIYNKPLAMEVIEGKLQAAYKKWISDNVEIYSLIRSTRYNSQLNSILVIYGL